MTTLKDLAKTINHSLLHPAMLEEARKRGYE